MSLTQAPALGLPMDISETLADGDEQLTLDPLAERLSMVRSLC